MNLDSQEPNLSTAQLVQPAALPSQTIEPGQQKRKDKRIVLWSCVFILAMVGTGAIGAGAYIGIKRSKGKEKVCW